MKIIKHYKQNRKEKMSFFSNIREILFHLHSGKKRVIVCVLAIGFNYYAMDNALLSNGQWVIVLTSEYFLLEIAKAFTREI